MKLPVRRVIGILNGFFNPLLLCAFLPIIEGAPGLDLTGPTGFWGQLIVATVIAEVLSALPLFGKTVGMCLDFFGFEQGSASHKIAGTVIGATLLFMVIGFGEIAFQGGFGTIEGRTFFARWAGLVTKGWAFVVIAGVLLDPFTAALGRMMVREERGNRSSPIECRRTGRRGCSLPSVYSPVAPSAGIRPQHVGQA